VRILLSNDDSVHARGIKILHKALSKIADVTVVAPLEEKSTAGHSLTLHKPLRVHKLEKNVYGVSGSPADCVYLATREILKFKPDLIVSGINRGGNLGQDIYYSGTVSAAREGCITGFPAIAVSLAVDFSSPREESKLNYEAAGFWTVKVIKSLMKGKKQIDIPAHTLLNINVPDMPLKKIKGVLAARQGFRYYGGKVLKRVDHRGREYFWVGGNYQGFMEEKATDCAVVEGGYVSLTPLKLDATDNTLLADLQEKWGAV
jgi:5'-nucleotidase